jgi:hypothetical protein
MTSRAYTWTTSIWLLTRRFSDPIAYPIQDVLSCQSHQKVVPMLIRDTIDVTEIPYSLYNWLCHYIPTVISWTTRQFAVRLWRISVTSGMAEALTVLICWIAELDSSNCW